LVAESLAGQIKAKRSELMSSEVEAVALRLFERHGYTVVTVDEIASEAGVSPRTFYRYFPSKEHIFQILIDRRCDRLRVGLAARPVDEPPLHSVHVALTDAIAAEDIVVLRRWMTVIAAQAELLPGVVGGKMLKITQALAEFFADRLGASDDSLVPQMLAAAVAGVTDAALVRWYTCSGDLRSVVSDSLDVLDRSITLRPEDYAHPHG
jgi:TetR/AcrR family transcriptional regulator, regulator of mycofactocin system